MAGGAATRASRTLRGIGLALVACILLAACARNEAPAVDAWRDWLGRDDHAAEVAAYAAYLRTEGVEAVVPMPELLRTSRRWRDCGHDAWAVPPRALWPRIVPTLRLIARIETDTGLRLDAARSGWRSETVNRCAGGAARSRHLQNVALDIDLPASLPPARRHGDGRRRQRQPADAPLRFLATPRRADGHGPRVLHPHPHPHRYRRPSHLGQRPPSRHVAVRPLMGSTLLLRHAHRRAACAVTRPG